MTVEHCNQTDAYELYDATAEIAFCTLQLQVFALEKVFYHDFHDGPNAGISVSGDIEAAYDAATAATNMNTVVATRGNWSSLNTGSQKVAISQVC